MNKENTVAALFTHITLNLQFHYSYADNSFKVIPLPQNLHQISHLVAVLFS